MKTTDIARRVCADHRQLMRDVVDYALATELARGWDAPDQELTIRLAFIVYYYVGARQMKITLTRPNLTHAWYYTPPRQGRPHHLHDALDVNSDQHVYGGDVVEIFPEDLAARVELDTADMDVFHQAIRVEEKGEVWDSRARSASARAEFWRKSSEEFIAKTWAPGRHADWCLSHDERRELGFVDERRERGLF